LNAQRVQEDSPITEELPVSSRGLWAVPGRSGWFGSATRAGRSPTLPPNVCPTLPRKREGCGTASDVVRPCRRKGSEEKPVDGRLQAGHFYLKSLYLKTAGRRIF
jgi:hypothetical protein